LIVSLSKKEDLGIFIDDIMNEKNNKKFYIQNIIWTSHILKEEN
jgi:hypothetical protein